MGGVVSKVPLEEGAIDLGHRMCWNRALSGAVGLDTPAAAREIQLHVPGRRRAGHLSDMGVIAAPGGKPGAALPRLLHAGTADRGSGPWQGMG
jgi:hypothetical protein